MNSTMDKNSNPRLSQASIVSTSVTQARATAGAVPAAALPAPGGGPDVGALIRRVFAHWPVVIVTMVLGAVITMQVVRTRRATFKSETVIQYREGLAKSINGAASDTGDIRGLGTKLKETLLAQQTLRKVIDEFHLYPEIVQRSGYSDAVDQIRKKTEFKARSVDTFAISFEGFDRDQAQRVCARMADILVAESAKRQQEDNKGATAFLEIEKKRLDDDLEKMEREITEFLQLHPEFASAKEGLGTEVLALKSKADDDEKRRRAKAARGVRRGRLDPTASGPAAGGPASADDRAPPVDPVLLAARSQAQTDLVAARRELAEKSLSFTDQHPDVRAARERVAAAEVALRRASEAIAAAQPHDDPPPRSKVVVTEDPYAEPSAKPLASVNPDRSPDRNPDRSADRDPDGEEKEKRRPKVVDPDQGEKVVSLEMEWSRLARALTLARGHQTDLEAKLYKAEMVANTAESGVGASIGLVDPAYKPSGPSNAPNKTVVMMGLAASIAIGFVLSAAWGLFFDDRLFSANEIEGSVMVPVLGVVPREKRKAKIKARDVPGPKVGLSRG
jgi:hypothetical protein